MNLLLKINDKFYMPSGAGVSVDGSSISAVMEMNRVLRRIQDWENHIPQIAFHMNCNADEVDIGFRYASNEIIVIEENKMVSLGKFF